MSIKSIILASSVALSFSAFAHDESETRDENMQQLKDFAQKESGSYIRTALEAQELYGSGNLSLLVKEEDQELIESAGENGNCSPATSEGFQTSLSEAVGGSQQLKEAWSSAVKLANKFEAEYSGALESVIEGNDYQLCVYSVLNEREGVTLTLMSFLSQKPKAQNFAYAYYQYF